jgi:3-oxoacid CoA-transferase
MKWIPKRETLDHQGHTYIKEAARIADFALVKAWKADTFGNLIFRETARNFNPVMARGAKQTFVEVEELVPHGALDPDEVHLPGIYVDAIIPGGHYEKRIMHVMVARGKSDKPMTKSKNAGERISKRDRIASRAAQEFREGNYGKLTCHEDKLICK